MPIPIPFGMDGVTILIKRSRQWQGEVPGVEQLLVGEAVATRNLEESLTGLADTCSRILIQLLLCEFLRPVETTAHAANVPLHPLAGMGIV